jgi:hypothetical protein
LGNFLIATQLAASQEGLSSTKLASRRKKWEGRVEKAGRCRELFTGAENGKIQAKCKYQRKMDTCCEGGQDP